MNASKSNKDCRKEIDAEKVKLNNSEADYNHLQADLVSGDAVYVATAERAMAARVIGVKSRLLSLPTRAARELAGWVKQGSKPSCGKALLR
jgi:hypothetical protein